MTDDQSPIFSSVAKSFEGLKRANEHGGEFWSARDLQDLLGYTQWRRFADAITRAMASCEASGNKVENHFAGAGNMVEADEGFLRKLYDFCCFAVSDNALSSNLKDLSTQVCQYTC